MDVLMIVTSDMAPIIGAGMARRAGAADHQAASA
jgi:hypothetical protein